ncbi:MAG: winged helix-turn-helix domain-containing protein [Rhodospirillales bacterium]|nr:winged helix-turn-helix domain-containing protein [Rhodospirillales bacterium]
MTMQNACAQSAFVDAHRHLKSRIVEGRAPVPGPALPVTERRQRALQTCHRYRAQEPERRPMPKGSGAYVPELAAWLEDDPHLCDGARRCARKLAEETYRQNREGRSLAVTVTYLARALGRCRRTVQRYLRQLEREGYIAVDVIAGARSRMCVGLIVRLCDPLIARHHRQKWPDSARNPGATAESQDHRFKGYLRGHCSQIPVQEWAMRCMDGVFHSFMKTNPLAGLPAIVPA